MSIPYVMSWEKFLHLAEVSFFLKSSLHLKRMFSPGSVILEIKLNRKKAHQRICNTADCFPLSGPVL